MKTLSYKTSRREYKEKAFVILSQQRLFRFSTECTAHEGNRVEWTPSQEERLIFQRHC